ncbi:MAG: XRE family transcriptional regulator [Rhodospirillales bacterium]|nr:XRE family transcriptional regulator [Rhodospirillales bacterium]MDK9720893.1 XRE family transcriptional regulator [Rhodospirillales bacterium]
MTRQKFASVWEAIEDTPNLAASLKARSDLMVSLQEHLKKSSLRQAAAAKLLGVTQPRISDLMRGRIDLFSMEALVDMLTAAGLRVEITLKRAA